MKRMTGTARFNLNLLARNAGWIRRAMFTDPDS